MGGNVNAVGGGGSSDGGKFGFRWMEQGPRLSPDEEGRLVAALTVPGEFCAMEHLGDHRIAAIAAATPSGFPRASVVSLREQLLDFRTDARKAAFWAKTRDSAALKRDALRRRCEGGTAAEIGAALDVPESAIVSYFKGLGHHQCRDGADCAHIGTCPYAHPAAAAAAGGQACTEPINSGQTVGTAVANAFSWMVHWLSLIWFTLVGAAAVALAPAKERGGAGHGGHKGHGKGHSKVDKGTGTCKTKWIAALERGARLPGGSGVPVPPSGPATGAPSEPCCPSAVPHLALATPSAVGCAPVTSEPLPPLSANTERVVDKVAQLGAGTAFERRVEGWFAEHSVSFTTDAELKEQQERVHGRAIATPDLLFSAPIKINGTDVHWLECKNFYATANAGVVGSPRFQKLVKQLKRYKDMWGPGCVVFAKGFATALPAILDGASVSVLVLDASTTGWGMRQARPQQQTGPSPASTPAVEASEPPKPHPIRGGGGPGAIQRFDCTVCGVTMNSKVQFDEHSAGAKHLNRIDTLTKVAAESG